MVTPQTVPVLESKLQELEADHGFLAEIRERNDAIDELQAAFDDAFEQQKKAKKALDQANAELREFIKAGPPAQSATPRLPFAGDLGDPPASQPAAAPAAEAPATTEAAPAAPAEPKTPAPAKVKIHIPEEIAALEITVPQKESLVKAGCQTVADVVDLGNKNRPEFPNGFDSLENFGPKAVAKLKLLLPSTAPAPAADEGQAVRVRLLTYSGQSENLKPGSEFDATELGNGNVLVQLPGEDPVEFLPHEFEKVEPVAV